MNSKELFSGRAAAYAKGRPAYPQRLVDDLYRSAGFSADSIIADVGAGTGLFSRLLLDRGSRVICVEPNPDMLRTARAALSGYSNVRFTDGDAACTKIEPASVDFITAAQSFHWFDPDLFRVESKRILLPNGRAILLWNTRKAEYEVNAACSRLFARYCPHFRGFSNGIQTDDQRIKRYFGGPYETAEYENPLVYSLDQFISRSLSSSYSLRMGEPDFEVYLQALEKLFEAYAQNGLLTIPNFTIVYRGAVA